MNPPATRPNLLLLGVQGAGKSSVLQRTMALLPRLRFGGFFVRSLTDERPPLGSPASMPGQRSRSERHLVLVHGRDRHLATRPVAWKVPGTQVMAVDPTSLVDEGLAHVAASTASADVVLLDELVRLGNACPGLEAVVLAAFDAPVRVVAATSSLELGWVAALAERDDCLVLQVTPANRAGYEKTLADLLTQGVSKSA